MNNKFIKSIAGTAEGIKLARAVNTATAAKLASESLINELSVEVQSIEANLTSQLDIGPETTDSLRPVGRNFDAASWVRQVHNLKVTLKRAQEKLDIAKTTHSEWFSEAPASPATA